MAYLDLITMFFLHGCGGGDVCYIRDLHHVMFFVQCRIGSQGNVRDIDKIIIAEKKALNKVILCNNN